MATTKNIGYIISEAAPQEDSNAKVIKEENGRVIAYGKLQEAEEVNRNARCYSKSDLFPEVNGKRMKELIDAKQFKGESGHPTNKDISRQQSIIPDKCCVKYLKVWTEGNEILAHFKGTHNELGNDFDMDLREGAKPAFSLRALGTIENSNGKSYVKNIRIITWDHVIYPSHPTAYTQGLLTESTIGIPSKAIAEGNDIYANNGKGLLIPITNDSVINYIKTESANIKSIIDNFDTLYESIEVINNGKHVQMMDKYGNLAIVRLESYIGDEVRQYCADMKI